jgi:CelD/BcsL family acetyltransferase involved in cellulose biosynthesis
MSITNVRSMPIRKYVYGAPATQVEIITEESEFLALEHIWNPLLQRSGMGNIFLTFEWLYTWWRHFGQGNRLSILVVRNQGWIVGLAPLIITNREGFRQLSMMGGRAADFKDFIIADDEDREAVIEAILDAIIKERTWDFFQLKGLREDSPNFHPLKVVISRFQDYRPVCYKYDDSLYIPIDRSWESYMSTLTSGFRKDSRRRMRSLNQEKGAISYYHPRDQREVEMYMDEFIKQHIIHWKEIKQEYSVFEHPMMVSFYKELAKQLFAKKWFDIHALLVNGEVAAIGFGFEYGNKHFPYMGAFKHEFFKYSVGRFLRLYAFKDAFSRGLREIDLLMGDESYKLDFNPRERGLYCVAFFQRGFRGYGSEKWFFKIRPRIEMLVQKSMPSVYRRVRKAGSRKAGG